MKGSDNFPPFPPFVPEEPDKPEAKTWKMPTMLELKIMTDPQLLEIAKSRREIKQMRIYRKSNALNKISQNKAKAIAAIQEISDRYYKNWETLMNTITRRRFFARCRDMKLIIGDVRYDKFRKGECTTLDLEYITTASLVTHLPVPTLIYCDLKEVIDRKIIVFDKCEAHISPGFFTDGIFFYARYTPHIIPIGNPYFKEYVDKENIDTRFIKL